MSISDQSGETRPSGHPEGGWPEGGWPEGGWDEARARARERVFALLSHEIRTPLNGVIGMAGLLASTPLDVTQTAYLATLHECADHLLGLVNDVLDLAKLEAGRIDLEPSATDIEHLLQGVCELLSPRAHAAGLEIGWAVDAGVPPLNLDDGRLRQILFNLAGNAVKLTRAGGVLVNADVAGPLAAGRLRVRFTVSDTGPGLDPRDSARIFEEFVQADAGERAGGAGLGLAIVKRLAQAFEGEVGVESRPGEGASFWFEAEFEAAGPVAAESGLEGLRIHLATQSPIVRAAAAGQLRACGAKLAPREACDVLLVDIGEDAPRPHPGDPPALVLLAPEARGRIEPLRALGYAGYLIKPLRRTSLAERVLAVARPATPIPDEGSPRDERATLGNTTAGLRVLLAEDNPVNALLARALLNRAGCMVDRAAAGEEAVSAALARPYDLILMDMRMPGMSGLDAARALRAAGCTTPVVALTANAFDDDRRACLEAGMDDFLTKPLDPAALEATLARLRPNPQTSHT
ncbi:response regulator [Caulobacter sp. S45]|uniref:response regulator n=1 Tax=Caulobacter sp. S45 TaxID=1641861 RepID=UPI001576DB0E|nr:response regulator [Caulobacter sp. S45]